MKGAGAKVVKSGAIPQRYLGKTSFRITLYSIMEAGRLDTVIKWLVHGRTQVTLGLRVQLQPKKYNYNPKRDVDHPLVKMQLVSQSIMREADEGRQAKMTATLFTQVGKKKSAQKTVSGQQPSLDSLVDGELAGNHTLSQITDPCLPWCLCT